MSHKGTDKEKAQSPFEGCKIKIPPEEVSHDRKHPVSLFR